MVHKEKTPEHNYDLILLPSQQHMQSIKLATFPFYIQMSIEWHHRSNCIVTLFFSLFLNRLYVTLIKKHQCQQFCLLY